MTFGAYIPRRSPIHQLSAKVKLLTLAIASVIIFQTTNLVLLTGLLTFVSLLPVVAKLPIRSVVVQLRSVVPLLMALFVLQGVLGDWRTGFVALLRFTILIELATIVTLTTQVSEMVEAIEQTLQPLRRFGIKPAQLSLMLALAIHLIPLLLYQFHEIQDAQRARGLDRNGLALFVPFLIKTLRMADELGEALDARGYE